MTTHEARLLARGHCNLSGNGVDVEQMRFGHFVADAFGAEVASVAVSGRDGDHLGASLKVAGVVRR